ncbi:MAG TPA: RagB/SusD family nutrient uptake outer membrane protein [Bacteroidales bacterium]|nr:RagB/SusD family nutrient uptake outer membrane protein [Bacteroidales bacterium]
MKKNIFAGIVLSVVCALCMPSCLNDFLTVEPLADITNENFWKSESDARAELNAGYAHIRKAYVTGFLYWTEARSDNFLGNVTGGAPVQNVSFNRLSSDLKQCDWNDWYNLISVANYALYFLPQMQDNVSEASYNHLRSEAYFLRAYAYFWLYRIWGDVPLMTQPTLKKSDVTKPRVTGKDTIFNQVVSDLAMADSLVDVTVDEKFIYSPGALYALITDVAMWQKDYKKAVEYSDKLYSLGKYTIEGVDFADVCSKATTTDNIWTLQWNYTTDGANSITTTLANSANPMIPTFDMYRKWFAWEREFGAIDARRVATIDSAKYKTFTKKHVNSLPSGAQCWKWSPGEHKAQAEYQSCYIPLYRLADIILLRAEALNKLGRMDEAIAEMNKVRIRAHLPSKDASYYGGDADKLDEDIFQEGQFELYAEGRRWFDLMRTGRVEKVMNSYFEGYITTYGGKGYHLFEEEWQHYWPIYQDILNENTNLHQIGNY